MRECGQTADEILTGWTCFPVAVDRTAPEILPVQGALLRGADALVALQGVSLVPGAAPTAQSLGDGLVVVQQVNGITPGRRTRGRASVAGPARGDGVARRGGDARGAATGAAARAASAAVAARAGTARGTAVVVDATAVVVVQRNGRTPGPGGALATAAPGQLVGVSGAAVQPETRPYILLHHHAQFRLEAKKFIRLILWFCGFDNLL